MPIAEVLDDLVDRQTEARGRERVALLDAGHGEDDLAGHAAAACEQQVGGRAVGREEVGDELWGLFDDRADEGLARDGVEGVLDVDLQDDRAEREVLEHRLTGFPVRVGPLVRVLSDPVDDLVDAGRTRDAELEAVEVLAERKLHARCDELRHEAAQDVAHCDRTDAAVVLLERDQRRRAEPRPDPGVEVAASGSAAEVEERGLERVRGVGFEQHLEHVELELLRAAGRLAVERAHGVDEFVGRELERVALLLDVEVVGREDRGLVDGLCLRVELAELGDDLGSAGVHLAVGEEAERARDEAVVDEHAGLL